MLILVYYENKHKKDKYKNRLSELMIVKGM